MGEAGCDRESHNETVDFSPDQRRRETRSERKNQELANAAVRKEDKVDQYICTFLRGGRVRAASHGGVKMRGNKLQ
jgi:hypothetical protein